MDEGVSDRTLLNVRDIDLGSLITQPDGSEMGTALDRLLSSHGENYNGFNNNI